LSQKKIPWLTEGALPLPEEEMVSLAWLCRKHPHSFVFFLVRGVVNTEQLYSALLTQLVSKQKIPTNLKNVKTKSSYSSLVSSKHWRNLKHFVIWRDTLKLLTIVSHFSLFIILICYAGF
jgi:hypothetical protein